MVPRVLFETRVGEVL